MTVKVNDRTFYLCIRNAFILKWSEHLNNSQVLRKLQLNHTSFSAISWWWCVNTRHTANRWNFGWMLMKLSQQNVVNHSEFTQSNWSKRMISRICHMLHIFWNDLWCFYSMNPDGHSNFKCFWIWTLSHGLNATGSISQLFVRSEIDPIDKSEINKVTWNN